jgi:hypothetical protein
MGAALPFAMLGSSIMSGMSMTASGTTSGSLSRVIRQMPTLLTRIKEIVEDKNDPGGNRRAMAAAYAQAQNVAKRRGFASTILTGPQGVTASPDLAKTVLGG